MKRTTHCNATIATYLKHGFQNTFCDFPTEITILMQFKTLFNVLYLFTFYFTLTVYTANGDWKSSEEECKVKHNSYLFGDLDLTDPKHACTLIHGQSQGPSWLGIAKEIFISNGGNFFNSPITSID